MHIEILEGSFLHRPTGGARVLEDGYMCQPHGETATRRWRLILIMLPLWLIPCLSVGAEMVPHLAMPAVPPASFVLTVHERALSLQAEAASLRAIMEEIGRQMHIDVSASARRHPCDTGVCIASPG